jgi:gamma-glutamylcyclotransferase (GGCT)/AIG2-like uncharacterized protein YtfP
MFNLKKSMRKLTEGKRQFFKESVLRPEVDASVIEPNRKKIRVFVFETLMNPEIRNAVLKSDIETSQSVIHNWKEINVESEGGPDYHTLVPDLGETTKGMILYVDEAQLAKLDYWEDQYDRVKAVLGSGEMTYVYILEVENMKDRGKNTSVELSPDDVDQIKWAADNM